MIRDAFFQIGPNGLEANVNASTTNPGLNGIPHQGEKDSVVDDKRASIKTPDITIDHGESDVIICARYRVKDDERGGNNCADDDGYDGLPPSQTQCDHGAPHHICRDVGVGENPWVSLVS